MSLSSFLFYLALPSVHLIPSHTAGSSLPPIVYNVQLILAGTPPRRLGFTLLFSDQLLCSCSAREVITSCRERDTEAALRPRVGKLSLLQFSGQRSQEVKLGDTGGSQRLVSVWQL